jgi:pathogenesis-related protein 1
VHSGGPYGENLFWGSAGYAWAASDAVGSWVAEKQYYNQVTVMRPLHAGGVACLQSSTAIGCARVVCSNNAGVFIICNYYPPGIVIGQSPY